MKEEYIKRLAKRVEAHASVAYDAGVRMAALEDKDRPTLRMAGEYWSGIAPIVEEYAGAGTVACELAKPVAIEAFIEGAYAWRRRQRRAEMDAEWPDGVEEVAAAPAEEDLRIGRVATADDCGQLVFVRDVDNVPWAGPYELLGHNDQFIPPYHVGKGPFFTAGFLQARIAEPVEAAVGYKQARKATSNE